MARYEGNYVTDVRAVLQDDSSNIWSEAQLTVHIQQAIRSISSVCPYEQKSPASTVEESKDIDISSLTGWVDIHGVEYPIDPAAKRNFTIWGDTLTLDISTAPTSNTEEGTLTGVVTFTSGSKAIAGVGTAFTTELSAGEYIRVSDGTTYYKVSSITSDTALTLSKNVLAADDGEDDGEGGATVYGGGPVYVYWTGPHTIGLATTTLPGKLEYLVIMGAAAYAGKAWLSEGRQTIADGISKIESASTAISNVTNRITQSINDLTSGREHIESKISDADTAINAMTDILARAVADIDSGRDVIGEKVGDADTSISEITPRIEKAIDLLETYGEYYINKVNVGGGVPEDFANYARAELSAAQAYANQASLLLREDQTAIDYFNAGRTELSTAMGYLNQAQGYLREHEPAGAYANYAARELANGQAYLSEGQGFLNYALSTLSVAGIIARYEQLAELDIALFKQELMRNRKYKTTRIYAR